MNILCEKMLELNLKNCCTDRNWYADAELIKCCPITKKKWSMNEKFRSWKKNKSVIANTECGRKNGDKRARKVVKKCENNSVLCRKLMWMKSTWPIFCGHYTFDKTWIEPLMISCACYVPPSPPTWWAHTVRMLKFDFRNRWPSDKKMMKRHRTTHR